MILFWVWSGGRHFPAFTKWQRSGEFLVKIGKNLKQLKKQWIFINNSKRCKIIVIVQHGNEKSSFKTSLFYLQSHCIWCHFDLSCCKYWHLEHSGLRNKLGFRALHWENNIMCMKTQHRAVAKIFICWVYAKEGEFW